MQTFSAHNILLRAEMIAKSADVKLMVSAPLAFCRHTSRDGKATETKKRYSSFMCYHADAGM
jgi:hypothetical protein